MKQTSKRPLLPAVTACLLGIVVALWTCSAFGPAATDGATPADAGSHDGTRPAAAPATAATSAAERTPAAPSGPLLTVRVEDRLDGAWLPGAVVFHREVPDLAALRTHAGRAAEAAITERLGRTLVADAQGRVQVPIDHAVQLVGRSGDRYGTLGLGVADAGDLAQVQRLRLDRDVALRVRVVDHRDERAARMPLELLPAGADSGAAPLELATDDDGLCAIGHWQDFAREAGYGRGGVDRVVVRCAVPGADAAGIVDVAAPPPELVLRLPATGRVVVRALDDAGPLAHCDLVLQAVPDGVPDDAVPDVLAAREWHAAAAGGSASFERVAVGRRYRVQTRVGAFTARAVFAGPQRADEEICVTLRAAAESAVLTGRALDERHEPIARANLRFVHATEAGAGSLPVATDGDGRFRVDLGRAAAQRWLNRGEFVVVARDAAAAAAVGMLHRLAPQQLQPGELDLGDLAFAPVPLLATGRVLSDDGSAAADLGLLVELLQTNVGTDRWVPDRLAVVASPAPGRFEVRGNARAARCRLRVASPRHLPIEPIEFAPGAQDLVVELRAGCDLRATIHVEPGLGAADLDVRLRPAAMTDGTAAPATGSELPATRSGLPATPSGLVGALEPAEDALRCAWSALWPGSYLLEVRAGGGDAVLASVPVQVAGGAQALAPDIDLRGRLHVIRWRVEGSDGRAVAAGAGNVVLVGGGPPAVCPQRLSLHDGSARLVDERPYADALVLAEGWLPARSRGTPGDNVVVLEPLPRVALRVRRGPAPSHDAPRLAVRLRWLGGSERIRELGTAGWPDAAALGVGTSVVPLDGADTASVPLAADGRYRVAVFVAVGDEWVGLDAVVPAEIDVAANGAPQAFEIRVDPVAIREAVAMRSR